MLHSVDDTFARRKTFFTPNTFMMNSIQAPFLLFLIEHSKFVRGRGKKIIFIVRLFFFFLDAGRGGREPIPSRRLRDAGQELRQQNRCRLAGDRPG